MRQSLSGAQTEGGRGKLSIMALLGGTQLSAHIHSGHPGQTSQFLLQCHRHHALRISQRVYGLNLKPGWEHHSHPSILAQTLHFWLVVHSFGPGLEFQPSLMILEGVGGREGEEITFHFIAQWVNLWPSTQDASHMRCVILPELPNPQ